MVEDLDSCNLSSVEPNIDRWPKFQPLRVRVGFLFSMLSPCHYPIQHHFLKETSSNRSYQTSWSICGWSWVTVRLDRQKMIWIMPLIEVVSKQSFQPVYVKPVPERSLPGVLQKSISNNRSGACILIIPSCVE